MRLVISGSRVISTLLFLGVALLPIYVWKSGGVQISHAILSVAALLLIVNRGLRLDVSGVLFIALVLLMLMRDGVYVWQTGSLVAMLPVFYSAFSLLIFLSVRQWLAEPQAWRYLHAALIVSGSVAVVGVYWAGYGATVSSDGEWRSIGTFNNPNQLGYFSVCLMSLAALLYLRGVMGRLWFAVISAMALFLSIASLSKAAMIACGFALVVSAFVVWRARGQALIGSGLFIALVVVALNIYNSGAMDHYKFVQRIRGIGSQDDDSLSERGYFILSDLDAEAFVFGRGYEVVKNIVGHEVHSTIASYFACYGYFVGIGFVLFLLLWFRRLVRQDGFIAALLVSAPPMMYGITHNGSRFTIFWILIAASMASVKSIKRSREYSGVSAGWN